MDIGVLLERQKWSLEQKIDHAVGTIENFMAKTGRTPYVSFSGGRDSTVLLDLCRRFINPKFHAVFDNTGNEFPEIVKFVRSFDNVTIISPKVSIRDMISKYGFPLLSKEVAKSIRDAKTTKSEKLLNIRLFGTDSSKGYVSGMIPKKWQFLIFEPFMISEKCCDVLKKRPLSKYNKVTGELPIIGTLASESKARQQAYIKRGGCNSFNVNHLASYPLSIWTDKDISDYICRFQVPVCSLYNVRGCERTGCMFCGFGVHLERHSRFNLVYDLHPTIYRAFMKYENNGVTYREALKKIGVLLPDEIRQLEFDF